MKIITGYKQIRERERGKSKRKREEKQTHLTNFDAKSRS